MEGLLWLGSMFRFGLQDGVFSLNDSLISSFPSSEAFLDKIFSAVRFRSNA